MAQSETLLGRRIQCQAASHGLNNDVRISRPHPLGDLIQVTDLDVHA